MLNTSSDFGYSEGHSLNGYDPHNGDRPKMFGLEPHHSNHMVHPGMHDFQHMVNAPPHHSGNEFDHEPLMMNMHNPSSHFYPHMGGQLLHVSSDYGNGTMDGTTPRSNGNGPMKRSREDLNMKEKKRMFKLNDRISQLKDLLDEAGVQSKKNKQSILDNTFHYIGMLRSNLLIAKQKAERAEKQVEQLRAQVQKNGNSTGITTSPVDVAYKRCFEQSSTARIIVDFNLEPVAYNMAFLKHSGLTEDVLMMKDILRAALCVDDNKLNYIVNDVAESNKPVSVVVQARTASGVSTLTLMASAMTDESGKPTSIEFSLIPFEIASDLPQQSFQAITAKQDGQESSPSSVELTF